MKIKTCISSVNTLVGDWSGQMVIVRHAIEAAKKVKADLLVLPELAICGPDARDVFLRPDTAYYAEQVLSEIVPQTLGLTVICGTPLMHDGHLYNVAAVFHDGRLLAFVPKRYTEGWNEEDRWFSRWDFEVTEPHLGAEIGAWNQTIPGMETLNIFVGSLSDHSAPMKGAYIVNLANRRFAPNLYREDLSTALELSSNHSCTVVRANMLGSDDGTNIYDGGGFIVSRGQIAALSPRFTFDEDFVVTCSDDKIPSAFDPSLAQFKKSGTCPRTGEDYAYAELELALCLGLNDYMKRANIERLCIGLSGGRDSAMVAVIAARMAALKNPELGEEELRAKVSDLLVSAYMPSHASSSSATQNAALALAAHFGFSCSIIPIGEIATACACTIENTVGREFSWENDDLTLQNVQARARSLIIWTLANANNAMLLTTGNMSEAAVGYSTIDGDASGCLDPIGNLPKTLVSRWLEWACHFHQIPAIELVLAQPPSAELRPLDKNQFDESDLMPYPVLDAYVEWFLVRRCSPKEVFMHAKNQLGNYYNNVEEIQRDIKRFIAMTSRSHWKRLRYANSFRVLPFDIMADAGLQWPCLQAPFTRACDEF